MKKILIVPMPAMAETAGPGSRLEHVRLYATVSFPTQMEYACEPKLAKGLNKLLGEWGPKVSSALELFEWADEKFCPSIPELEPFDKKVTYIGTMKAAPGEKRAKEASKYLKPQEDGNIHVAQKWNFAKLLGDAALFINHGGQNSVVDGLLYGVPQLLVPGKVFERKYNARSVENADAGKLLSHEDFHAGNIRKMADELITSEETRANARALGEKLIRGGGVNTILQSLNEDYRGTYD